MSRATQSSAWRARFASPRPELNDAHHGAEDSVLRAVSFSRIDTLTETTQTQTPAFDRAATLAQDLRRNVETVVLGKPDAVALTISALAAGGHVLLEDVPGTAKTVLAR